jgi:hypothetical protein
VVEVDWWPNYQPSREDTIPADCQHSACALGASMATQRLTFQPSPAHLLARGAADAAAAAAGVPSAAAGLGAAPLAAERLLAVHRPRGLAALTALVHFLPAHSCAGAGVTPAGLATDGKSAQTELPPQGQGAQKSTRLCSDHTSCAAQLQHCISQSANQLISCLPTNQAHTLGWGCHSPLVAGVDGTGQHLATRFATWRHFHITGGPRQLLLAAGARLWSGKLAGPARARVAAHLAAVAPTVQQLAADTVALRAG